MSQAGFTWECSCGHIEYGEESPEECSKCFSLDSFVKLPEELVNERSREMPEEDEGTISALKKNKSLLVGEDLEDELGEVLKEKIKKQTKKQKTQAKPKSRKTKKW